MFWSINNHFVTIIVGGYYRSCKTCTTCIDRLATCSFCTLQEQLTKFILACQDEETGGFADRPGDMVHNIV